LLFLLLSISFEVLGFDKLKIQPLPFHYDSPLLPFSYVDCTHLKRFQRSFVITYMDKCSNNFVFLSEALGCVSFNDIISLEDTHVKSRLSESAVKFFIVLSTLLLGKVLKAKCGPCLPFLFAVWMFDKDNSLILVQFPYKLSLVRRFVDDIFVPVILDFSNFMYLDKQSIGGGIYPKSFCELH
jgi:hypothetical protein